MRNTPLLCKLLLVSAALPASAQAPFLRATDMRTLPPEAVMRQRSAWGADLSFGGSLTRGNVEVDYLAGGFNLFAARGPSAVYLTGSLLRNTFGNVTVSNTGALTLRGDRKISGPWKAFAYHTDAYNEFLRVNHRTTTGAGPWYDLDWGLTRHGLSLALAHEYERFKGGRIERAGRLSWRSLSRVPLSRAAELSADFFYVPKLDDFGDHRLYAELSLTTLVWKEVLALKLAWIDEYDSRPRPGVKRNDSIWLPSLTLRLGR